MSNNRTLGDFGEDLAVKLLKKAGYKILERNYKSPFGEIDIIALDGKVLVFIEVKLRNTLEYGFASEAVNIKKQRKIVKSALVYVKRDIKKYMDLRFDVVALGPGDDNSVLIKSAFIAEPGYTV